MKVSIGTKIKDGPWGGGNLFAINLKNHLQENGHRVIHNLNDDDIDIILITEPRKTSESSAFTQIDVLNYLKYINRNALVVHRINECDERKNTNYVNKYMINANKISDYTIFVSEWLKNLYVDQGISTKNNYVILSGANKKIFNNNGKKLEGIKNKYSIVTHHWGSNWNKGFETYTELDRLIGTEKYKDKIEFTYIGNTPNNVSFKNSNVVAPLSGIRLAEEIKKHDIYLTGSLNEPSGNHHIEGAQCGLPILYINSGGIPEYCNEFGVMFEIENFESKLNLIVDNFEKYFNKMSEYPQNSKKMCDEYLYIFEKMINNRSEIVNQRKIDLTHGVVSKKIYKFLKNFKIIKNI